MHIDQVGGQNDAVPTEKKPAPSSRKPPPPRRPRADEPDDESIARRRPPRPGVDDVLTAEVLEQMQLRGGYSRSEMARRIGWRLGCSLSSLLVGAGIDHAEVDLVDAVYSDDRLSRGAKEAIVFLIRKDRGD